MEAVLEGGSQGDIVIRIRTALRALHCWEPIQTYLTLPCGTCNSQSPTCPTTGTLVTWTVGNVGEDPRSNVAVKTARDPAHGG